MDSKLYWLSFASSDGLLGVAIVQASDPQGALRKAGFLGLNPGGEVLIAPVPPDHLAEAWPYRNRLLQRDECVRIFGPATSKETLNRALNAGAVDLVCEDCNSPENK